MDNFYERCAEILGVEYEGREFPYYRRTRWNNRVAGQGRFEGYGIIRKFGDKFHIAFRNPPINAILSNEEEIFNYLQKIVDGREKVI